MTKEEAITFLQGRIDIIDKHYPQIEDYREALVIAIKALEQEPKIGHWIEKDGFYGDTHYDCSECGESFCLIDGTPTDNMYKHCPNCGVKMKSEVEE